MLGRSSKAEPWRKPLTCARLTHACTSEALMLRSTARCEYGARCNPAATILSTTYTSCGFRAIRSFYIRDSRIANEVKNLTFAAGRHVQPYNSSAVRLNFIGC